MVTVNQRHGIGGQNGRYRSRVRSLLDSVCHKTPASLCSKSVDMVLPTQWAAMGPFRSQKAKSRFSNAYSLYHLQCHIGIVPSNTSLSLVQALTHPLNIASTACKLKAEFRERGLQLCSCSSLTLCIVSHSSQYLPSPDSISLQQEHTPDQTTHIQRTPCQTDPNLDHAAQV